MNQENFTPLWPTESQRYMMNPYRVNGEMSTLVPILLTSHPEAQKAPNYTSWSGWFNGPKFLRMEEENWPKQPSQLPELPLDDIECRKCPARVNVIVRGARQEQDKYNKRWRQAKCLADAFRKRWLKDYLPSLQRRQKWYSPRRNLAVGDLVLVVDEKMPLGRWPMGVIEEVYPDSNGHIRNVRVRTASSSVCRRDIRKLCHLEGVQDPGT
ncbi:hypothetical protein AWC38_SpisGene14568 [Stylophora pistillata]|uniref:DUF5641 domain-containing protein n=1 Tax=Stylophora pistillata TaxID=50429 RepID=A0A2B4RTN4_STYPI|nr:hypothetical protein AWC38_SpisGene14568 [Stylophora pistillata]